MEISNCIHDFAESLVYLVLAIIAEIFLCLVLSWNKIAIYACVVINIILSIDYLVDWFYLSRRIILDEVGCTFVSGKCVKRFKWHEMKMQHVDNTSFLFGDSEIPCKGVILSAKPISKPKYIGAMTYCRFTHPLVSVFIRFPSSSDNIKRASAKFVYQGFSADKSEMLFFFKKIGKLID